MRNTSPIYLSGLLLVSACSGSDADSADAAPNVSGDAQTAPGTDAAGGATGGATGGASADATVGSDSTPIASDAAPPTGGSPGPAPSPADGDRFCLVGEQMGDALWAYDSSQRCSAIKLPEPWDGSMDAQVEYACQHIMVAGLTSAGRLVPECPPGEVAAVCQETQIPGLPYFAGYRVNTFVYASPITPDAASVARNALRVCGGSAVVDPSGRPLTAKCAITATAQFMGPDGLMANEVFTTAECSHKRVGDRVEYVARAYADQGNAAQRHVTLRLERKDGEYVRVSDLARIVGDYTGNGNWFTPANVEQQIDVTAFDDAGSGFSANFTLQLADVFNPMRQATLTGQLKLVHTVE